MEVYCLFVCGENDFRDPMLNGIFSSLESAFEHMKVEHRRTKKDIPELDASVFMTLKHKLDDDVDFKPEFWKVTNDYEIIQYEYEHDTPYSF